MQSYLRALTTIFICLFALCPPAKAGIESPHGELDISCAECHSTEGWGKLLNTLGFDHNLTSFPLESSHAAVGCRECHADLKFNRAVSECIDCHLDVHRGQFADECSRCHKPDRWEIEQEMRRLHVQTRFPLFGVHASLDCAACHRDGQYVDLPTDCSSCHLDDYRGTYTPDHTLASFTTECTECHQVANRDWNQAAWDHPTTFPLVQSHAIQDCRECHATEYLSTSAECYSCHRSDYIDVDDPDHAGGGFSTACAECHSISVWSDARFDHTLSSFQLTGAHNDLNCVECHLDDRYTGTPQVCFGCHSDDYDAVADPRHDPARFARECETCHTNNSWQPAEFDHALALFQLEGAHTIVNCAECHLSRYTGTPSICFDCHEDDYDEAADPEHLSIEIEHDCTICHSPEAWTPSYFDHNATDFALTGEHIVTDCSACHDPGQFNGIPQLCFDCHDADYNDATNPEHLANSYDTSCETCHTTDGWSPAVFDHSMSEFILDGAHDAVTCENCHVNNDFVNTPSECYGCHQDDFETAPDPNHLTGDFSQQCQECHTTTAWTPAEYNHDLSDFPLTGAHVSLDCNLCHLSGYTATPSQCFDCHDDDYEGASDPDHTAAQFDHNCLDCHTTDAWSPSTFDHSQTDYTLEGAHGTVACSECHVNGQFDGTSDQCFACHDDDYREVNNPTHVDESFSHQCIECHSFDAWTPSSFDHDDDTEYPLDGAHTILDCNMCHEGAVYTGTPSICFGCHEHDYNGVDDPDHSGNNFSQDCATCHSEEAWTPATFDHDLSDFPLEGAHQSVECIDCHLNGQYTNTPSDCFFCHEDDFNDADDPDHVLNEFSQRCTECHSMDGWEPADFNHDDTDFPLEGGHRNVDCAECHRNGQYTNTPTLCFFCHEDDYNDVDDPDHRSAGFPRDCQLCHDIDNWDSTLDHDGRYFPIFSGSHGYKWDTCSDCHTNPNDYSVFSCIDCHRHNREDTDDDHDEVNNYRYESVACLECHPDGREDDFRNIRQNRQTK